MTRDPLKYARVERERRFLVSPASAPALSVDFTRFEDLYLDGTHLRLRVASASAGEVEYKLTQKLQQSDARLRVITTTYLSAAEHRTLSTLAGKRLVKRRHRVRQTALEWGVDVFEGALAGLVLAEIEAETDAALRAIAPPSFAPLEVTDYAAFTGGALAATEPGAVLARALALLGGAGAG